ncbi:MAG TPA: lysophospholipid acyltransferase family protein [Longimicrobiales bacterium]
MSGRAPRLRHRIEYVLFRTAAAAAAIAGDAAAGRLMAAAGRLAYAPLGIRRRAVEAHLRRAFPERDDAWIRDTAAAAYAHLGREGAAMIRLASLDREHILARTEVEGLEAFRAALEPGRGIVLVTGHLGNWEIGGAALAARGIPIDGVAQRQSNPLFDRAIVAARERLGMRVIERSRAVREGLRALRAGRVVALVADQDARRAGVFVPFFGHPASTHRGPATLALRTGAPLFLGTALRSPHGGYRVRLEPVEVDRHGDPDDVVRRLTAAFTARLEAAIRAAPDQYLWHHRRWKTRPPEEPPRAAAGITDGPDASGRRPRG